MKDKSRRLYLIIIGCFIVITLALLIAIVTYKPTKESKNTKGNEIKNEHKYDAVNIIKYYSYGKSRENGIESFSNQELFNMYFYFASIDEDQYELIETKSTLDQVYQVSTSELDNFFKMIFGPNIVVNYKNFEGLEVGNEEYDLSFPLFKKIKRNSLKKLSCGFTNISYDESIGKLKVEIPSGCGGAGYVETYSDITETKITEKDNNGELQIVNKILYRDCDEETKVCKFYKDTYKNTIISEDNESNTNKYIEDGLTVTMNFRMNSNTDQYYFVNSYME